MYVPLPVAAGRGGIAVLTVPAGDHLLDRPDQVAVLVDPDRDLVDHGPLEWGAGGGPHDERPAVQSACPEQAPVRRRRELPGVAERVGDGDFDERGDGAGGDGCGEREPIVGVVHDQVDQHDGGERRRIRWLAADRDSGVLDLPPPGERCAWVAHPAWGRRGRDRGGAGVDRAGCVGVEPVEVAAVVLVEPQHRAGDGQLGGVTEHRRIPQVGGLAGRSLRTEGGVGETEGTATCCAQLPRGQARISPAPRTSPMDSSVAPVSSTSRAPGALAAPSGDGCVRAAGADGQCCWGCDAASTVVRAVSEPGRCCREGWSDHHDRGEASCLP